MYIFVNFLLDNQPVSDSHNFILGQIIIPADQTDNIDNYVCKQNELKLTTCIYDLAIGEFQGLKSELAFIVLRGDSNEFFFSCGFDSDKAGILYSTSKQKIPDAFLSTVFKKRYSEIIDGRREKEEFLTLFYYLPSITDRKEEVNQHGNNVNLSPVDCSLSFIESFATKKGENFRPQLLNSTDSEKHNPQVEMLCGLFKQIAQYSNNKIIRNADFLLSKHKRRAENMPWVGANEKRFDSTMFKLTY